MRHDKLTAMPHDGLLSNHQSAAVSIHLTGNGQLNVTIIGGYILNRKFFCRLVRSL